MNSVVIGMGQIGTAVKAVTGSECSYDLRDGSEIGNLTFTDKLSDVDVLHICIPYGETFAADVKHYMLLRPKHVAVWSTVPIGTCESIDPKIVHTPVEGKHPDLELSIRNMERWIGAVDEAEGEWFTQYFGELSLKTKVVASSRFTEALKLLSTTEYGVNIEFARYKKHVADSLDMPYKLMKDWNSEYNRLYRDLGLGDKYQKFVLDAPEGAKGGHCVTNNSRLLQQQYPNDMVRTVGEL